MSEPKNIGQSFFECLKPTGWIIFVELALLMMIMVTNRFIKNDILGLAGDVGLSWILLTILFDIYQKQYKKQVAKYDQEMEIDEFDVLQSQSTYKA